MNARTRHRVINSPSAFTLVELMVAVALMLIMMISINQIFRTTAETVGAGNALSTVMRDRRAAFATMADDFNSVTPDGPCFIIHSEVIAAFMDANDKAGASWSNSAVMATRIGEVQKTTDANGVAVTYPIASLSPRTHRSDIVSFFARNFYKRRTGTGTYGYFGPNTTNDAWIQYGHLRLPIVAATTATADFRDPGADVNPLFPITGYDAALPSNNPNNYYARNWVLGRNVTLMRDSSVAVGSETIATHVIATAKETPNNVASLQYPNLTPFSVDTNWNNTYRIHTSRFDISGSTIEQFAITFSQFLQYYPKSQWWKLATDYSTDPSYEVPDRANGAEVPGNLTWPNPLTPISDVKPGAYSPDTTMVFRYQCNPFVTKPLNADGTAFESPYFLGGCTQFAVEYAGDFVTQLADGTVTKGVPDGTIDFVIPTLASGVPDAGVRKIRWYGLPRDSNGDGVILGRPTSGTGSTRVNNDLPDVIPLRDILNLVNAPPALFERYDPNTNPNTGVADWIPSHDYYDRTSAAVQKSVPMLTARDNYASTSTGLQPNDVYNCAWQFSAPKMIRVVLQLDDANGRISNATPFEFVFSIQP